MSEWRTVGESKVKRLDVGQYEAAVWESLTEGRWGWVVYQRGINPDGSDGCVARGEEASQEAAMEQAETWIEENGD